MRQGALSKSFYLLSQQGRATIPDRVSVAVPKTIDPIATAKMAAPVMSQRRFVMSNRDYI